MKTALFWYLQAQGFYRTLHKSAIKLLGSVSDIDDKTWGDFGCGLGLMGRLSCEDGFSVHSYDLDESMIKWAKVLHKSNTQLNFEQKDVMSVSKKFDVVSATSLLSVVDDKAVVLKHLVSLLKDENSKLVLIEPTEKMNLRNAWKSINSLKSLYYYKMLLVWAKARQGKSVNMQIFSEYKNTTHHYFLDEMVRITIIGK